MITALLYYNHIADVMLWYIHNNFIMVLIWTHHIAGDNPSDAIHAFIPDTQSWLHVADLPEPMHSASSLVLPSGDLVVIKEKMFASISTFKASLKGIYVSHDNVLMLT